MPPPTTHCLWRKCFCLCAFLLISTNVSAWTNCCREGPFKQHRASIALNSIPPQQDLDFSSPRQSAFNRRDVMRSILHTPIALTLAQSSFVRPALAYTPDPDKLRESLYLMSRVQEATVQQERFVNRATKQEDLKSKMKLTLRLVEKNYRLLDQITFASNYITDADAMVDATNAGYEAAEALQNAIDYVNAELRQGPFEKGQKEYLTSNLRECRDSLFVFLDNMPQTKLAEARKRVEEENVLNRDEFDGDSDAGVFNPVVLPWKSRE